MHTCSMSPNFVDSSRVSRVPVALIVLIDLIVSFGVGALILLYFKIDTTIDTDPQICKNGFGDGVTCSTNDSLVVLSAVSVTTALLLGSLWIQRRFNWI